MRRTLIVALLFALLAVMAASPHTLGAQSRVTRAESGDSSHDAIVRRAERASATGRWDEAAELWRWAIAADDRTPEHWWKLGYALFNANRHRESIAAFERALQLGAGEPAVGAWQISRAYAHRGDRTQALRWLGHAVQLGFDSREAVRQEPLFEQYRSDPRFAELSDSTSTGRRSLPRVPAARARHAPVRKVEPSRLAGARPLHARDQAVRAGTPVDDALGEVVREILERHHIGEGADAEHHAAARRHPVLFHEPIARAPLPAPGQPGGGTHGRRLCQRVRRNEHDAGSQQQDRGPHVNRFVHSTMDPQLSRRPKMECPVVKSGATAARTNTSSAATSSERMALR